MSQGEVYDNYTSQKDAVPVFVPICTSEFVVGSPSGVGIDLFHFQAVLCFNRAF